MDTLSIRERDRFHDDIIRRMAKPKHIRDLEDQAERLERQKRAETQALFDNLEANDLRRRIRDMGEKPCA